MSESTSTLVECPVCEEAFDPTAAGGWCTNSECGEWQHEGANLPTGDVAEADADVADTDAEDEARTADADPDVVDTDAEDEVQTADADMADANAEDEAQTADADVADTDAEDEVQTVDADETTDEIDDESASDRTEHVDDPTPAIRRVSEDEGVSEAKQEGTTDDTEPASESDEKAKISCPGCAETLAADVNFCPSCGEDLSAVDPGQAAEELTACPACDADVGPEASFCPSCGEDLDAHRESTALTACPSCEGDIEPEDSFCPSCGENLDAHREAATGAADAAAGEAGTGEAPDSLILRARGEELTVEDGDAVGRELRRIVTDTGGDESEAVRIHREHVRFVREDDGFHVVDLGRNPTRLNDDRLEQGDQAPVEPGDELTLSNVITLAVGEP